MIKVSRNVENNWVNEGLRCWRSGSLVYVRMLKNASSYYTKVFLDNHWQEITFNDIDWTNDTVFGFIQDPFQRYIKGLTEDAWSTSDAQTVIRFLLDYPHAAVCLISYHTNTIHLTIGDRMYDMTWIPIDVDQPSQKRVDQLCSKHNITINWPKNQKLNESPPEKLELFQQVKTKLGNGSGPLWRMLSRDIDLYHAVIADLNTI